MAAVHDAVFVAVTVGPQDAVEFVVGIEKVLLVVSADEIPMNGGKLLLVLCVEVMDRAMLLVVIRDPGLSALLEAAEDHAPLVFPAALGLFHILPVRADGHGKRCTRDERLGVLFRQGTGPEAAHRVAGDRAVLLVGDCAVLLVDERDKLVHEHVHVVI